MNSNFNRIQIKMYMINYKVINIYGCYILKLKTNNCYGTISYFYCVAFFKATYMYKGYFCRRRRCYRPWQCQHPLRLVQSITQSLSVRLSPNLFQWFVQESLLCTFFIFSSPEWNSGWAYSILFCPSSVHPSTITKTTSSLNPFGQIWWIWWFVNFHTLYLPNWQTVDKATCLNCVVLVELYSVFCILISWFEGGTHYSH